MPSCLLLYFRQIKDELMNIFFVSLGCDKNRVDAERMLGTLAGGGYTLTTDETQADIIVVNTCCFIDDAKEESIGEILSMARLKEGRARLLVVAGCMAQRYKEEILQEIPEVDIVIGTTAYDRIIEAVEEALSRGDQMDMAKRVRVEDPSLGQQTSVDRLLTTGGSYAYLKIAEGCDKNCTYCIIPKLRGHYRSVPVEELVREASVLAGQGVRELILVAQETTLYGRDLYGEKRLPDLIRALAKVEGIRWIRLLYCYPEEITDELIETMQSEPKFCHYLDLPIQHASDAVLKRMGRRTSKEQLRGIVAKLRRMVPDICLRTTLISGFPGETDAQHEELLEFVEEMAFDRLGVFTYSREEDTPAASMDGQVDSEVMQLRRSQIMELQQRIVYDKENAHIGRLLTVLVERETSRTDAGEYIFSGRTYMDAPDVDSVILVRSPRMLVPGDMVTVQVMDSDGYDLIGSLQDERTDKEDER